MAFLRSHVQIPKVMKQTQDFLILSFLLMFGTETSLVHFCCTLSSSWVSVELSTQDAYYLDASYSSQKHFQQHFFLKKIQAECNVLHHLRQTGVSVLVKSLGSRCCKGVSASVHTHSAVPMSTLQEPLLRGPPLSLQRLMIIKLTLQATGKEIDHIQF